MVCRYTEQVSSVFGKQFNRQILMATKLKQFCEVSVELCARLTKIFNIFRVSTTLMIRNASKMKAVG